VVTLSDKSMPDANSSAGIFIAHFVIGRERLRPWKFDKRRSTAADTFSLRARPDSPTG